MGGEGAMSHANISSRNNKALLKRVSTKKRIQGLHTSRSDAPLIFKKVSPEELDTIKTKIKAQAKRRKLTRIWVILISMMLTIVIVGWFLYLVN